MSFKLYEVAGLYATLCELDEQGQDVRVALDSITEDLHAKAENTAKVIRNIEAEAKAYDSEIIRLLAHKRALENRADALKRYLLEALQGAGLAEVKGAVLKIRVQNSPATCEIPDETAIPWPYRQVVESYAVDRRKIVEVLKAGGEVPGASLRQGQHVRLYP